MNERPDKPPAAWLEHLHEAGHWERLIEMALRCLAVEPTDADAHRHLAWAYAKTKRFAEMCRHVDFLLKSDSDDARNHHLAAIYFLERQQHKKARSHIDFLLGHEPNSATYHYLACIQSLRSNRVADARRHINMARAQAPHWAAAAHLEIRIDGIGQKKARQAWARVRRLKETLSLDPRNADVMTTAGDILLTELERPREAEAFYREALLIDPLDTSRQEKLLDSIRARSVFYRTLSLPSSVVRKVRKAMKEKRHWYYWVYLLIIIKVVMFIAAWVLVVGLFFAPAAKVYELLVLSDLPQTKALPPFLAPFRSAREWPLWLRLFIALGLIATGWLILLVMLFHLTAALGMQIMLAAFGIHFAAVALVVGAGKLRARAGQWQEARRIRKERCDTQSEI